MTQYDYDYDYDYEYEYEYEYDFSSMTIDQKEGFSISLVSSSY